MIVKQNMFERVQKKPHMRLCGKISAILSLKFRNHKQIMTNNFIEIVQKFPSQKYTRLFFEHAQIFPLFFV
jgi:hypothetical protein